MYFLCTSQFYYLKRNCDTKLIWEPTLFDIYSQSRLCCYAYLLPSRSACSCILASSNSLLLSSYLLRKDDKSLHLSSYLLCSAKTSSWSLVTCSFWDCNSVWAFKVCRAKRKHQFQNGVYFLSTHFSQKVLQINYKDVWIKEMLVPLQADSALNKSSERIECKWIWT